MLSALKHRWDSEDRQYAWQAGRRTADRRFLDTRNQQFAMRQHFALTNPAARTAIAAVFAAVARNLFHSDCTGSTAGATTSHSTSATCATWDSLAARTTRLRACFRKAVLLLFPACKRIGAGRRTWPSTLCDMADGHAMRALPTLRPEGELRCTRCNIFIAVFKSTGFSWFCFRRKWESLENTTLVDSADDRSVDRFRMGRGYR